MPYGAEGTRRPETESHWGASSPVAFRWRHFVTLGVAVSREHQVSMHRATLDDEAPSLFWSAEDVAKGALEAASPRYAARTISSVE